MSPTLQAPDGQQFTERMGHDGSVAMAEVISDKGDKGAARGDDDITATQKMLSAMSGSLLTSLLVTPLDVVRVRWQSQPVSARAPIDFSKLALTTTHLNPIPSANLGVAACCREVFFMNNNAEFCLAMPQKPAAGGAVLTAAECAAEEAERKTFSSTLDGMRKIARHEGITSLWRGLSPTLVMAVPANIIYFTGYDWLRFNPKSPLAQRLGDDSAPLVAGSAARALAGTAVGPIELFRTRLQASAGSSTTSHLTNTFKSVQEMVQVSGYRSLWRGLSLTLWRDMPFSGLYWWGYETIRGRLTDMRETKRGRSLEARGSRTRTRRRSQSRENHTDTFVDSFIAGAVSGAAASIVTMPFDVGKTRTQVYRDGSSAAKNAASKAAVPEEGSMTRLLWHIFKTEGVPGLFRGWIPRTLKIAPACAIMISSYEIGKKVFRGANAASRDELEGK
ncbi:hypothetical protein D7B24_002626 [Verticillium nonalfalfae]|uniref:Uncharacterized protein n=1 Tax=Verticillium nonalfalfae TaxID=1051616 RepID=A0A3M9XXC1_9PEZI|nr:uncharacterized protein D7B24_002626 [Verticillium nonalfalfae]RNJ52929.1 hypothetical protein D7B24_002626 [Verticillium nonalfalfae]